MKLGKGSPSVWPGYVAAMASLLLSLLLLLSVLVYAMTQVGTIAERYAQQIMRAVMQDELNRSSPAGGHVNEHRPSSTPTAAVAKSALPPPVGPPPVAVAPVAPPPVAPITAPAAAVAPMPAPPAAAAVPAGSVPLSERPSGPVHLRLVFESGVSELQPSQVAEIEAAVRQLKLPPETAWRLQVSAPETDPMYQRSAYRLLLQTRGVLSSLGYAPSRIGLQLTRSAAPPPGYERGEIAIYLAHNFAGGAAKEAGR